METEVGFAVSSARSELTDISQVLVSSILRIGESVRVPVTGQARGMVRREFDKVHVVESVHASFSRHDPVKLAKTFVVAQIPMLVSLLEQACETLVLCAQTKSIESALKGITTAREAVTDALKILERPNSSNVFPAQVEPLSIGVCAEAFIEDSALVLAVHYYHDKKDTHISSETVYSRCPDPCLMMVGVQLTSVEHRLSILLRRLELALG